MPTPAFLKTDMSPACPVTIRDKVVKPWLSPEERLILLLSRATPSPDALEQAGRLIEGGIDLDRVVGLAGRNETAPLLFRNLEALQCPEAVPDRLKNAYLYTLSSNLRRRQETLAIIGLLRDRRIDAVALKGPLLAGMLFGDEGLYPSSDIDILVMPSQLDSAKKVLLENGYTLDEKDEKNLLESHYHLIFSKDGHQVEMHWNLVKRYFTVPPEFWWTDSTSFECGGSSLTMPSLERYLLYLIFRAYDHGFRPLKFLVVISEMINRHREEVKWEAFLEYAETYHMGRLVSFVLHLLRDFFDTRIPDHALRGKIAGYGILRKVILSGLFRDQSRPHLRMMVYAHLLDTPQARARALLGRLFPSAGELRLRYGLPLGSKKIFLYFIMNPLLLLSKRQQ
jgi:hypothetical protein